MILLIIVEFKQHLPHFNCMLSLIFPKRLLPGSLKCLYLQTGELNDKSLYICSLIQQFTSQFMIIDIKPVN